MSEPAERTVKGEQVVIEGIPVTVEMARGLTSRSVPCLPVLVDRATGLTEEHADSVKNWLHSLDGEAL